MDTNTKSNNHIANLFSSGAHFGFTKRRRHPSVVPFLYGSKDGNDIFDLTKTATQLEEASELLANAAQSGKTVLFVGTKDEVKSVVEDKVKAINAPYVVNRWIGGLLTNFSEIRKRVQRLHDLLQEQESGSLERKYTKKERVVLGREIEKLRFNFEGVKDMDKKPDFLVVVDPRHEDIAVKEAHTLGVPVIGIMSSDCDARGVSHPIMMNDSLQDSVGYALTALTEAYSTAK